MAHPRTLFRVLLRFLGVWFIASGLVSFVPNMVGFLLDPGPPARTLPSFGWYHDLRVGSYVILGTQLGLGLYLLLGGGWLVNIAFPSRDRCCPHCGYCVNDSPQRCPECGASLPSDPPENPRSDV